MVNSDETAQSNL